MKRQWFAGVIFGEAEIKELISNLGYDEGDSVACGDTMVRRGEFGEVEVYTKRFTEWPDQIWKDFAEEEARECASIATD